MNVFQAGEEVILEDGFDSGNNFIAEIVPCVPTVTIISPKPEPEEFITEHYKNIESENYTNKILDNNSNETLQEFQTLEGL